MEGSTHIAGNGFFLRAAQGRVPTDGRIVVVSARIHDAVVYVVLRQVGVLRLDVLEADLQQLHAGKTQLVAQLLDVRRDEPQVFGQEWQSSELAGPSVPNRALPGTGIHWPWTAVHSWAGIAQQAAKPRKWSMRMMSTSSNKA